MSFHILFNGGGITGILVRYPAVVGVVVVANPLDVEEQYTVFARMAANFINEEFFKLSSFGTELIIREVSGPEDVHSVNLNALNRLFNQTLNLVNCWADGVGTEDQERTTPLNI